MKKTRIISSVLLSAIITGASVSCGSTDSETYTDTNERSDTVAENTEPTRENTPDSLPEDLNFNGETLRIICRDNSFNIQEINAELTGDIVDDAIYNRNRMVEDRLNILIDCLPTSTDANQNAQAIYNSVMSGSDDYDLVSGIQYSILPQSLEGIYQNLNGNEYIDLSQPWWWTSYIDELKIGDEATYFLIGDLALNSIQNMSCIFFNKEMLTDLGTSPDDLYALVLDGGWTYEKLNEYARLAYRDVNGNNEYDEDDTYGLRVRVGTEPDHFTYTAGNEMSTRDSNGIPALNVNTEYFAGYMETLYNLYYNNEGVYIATDETKMFSQFSAGDSLFLASRFVAANFIRDMEDEYGIIPFPKYMETQENYGALVHDSATIFCIPVTASRTDMISAALEALCAQSYRTVIPAYYEMALKTKYVSDSTSGEIIDMIKNAAKTDFVYAYNYALNGAGLLCRTMITRKTTDFASTWASIEAGAEKGLEELISLYEQLDS